MWKRIIATIAALLVPGGGALVQGHHKRAACLFVAIGGLVLGGLVIGGVGAVDRRTERWWFVLQAPAGVSVWIVDHLVQTQWKGLSRGELRLPVAGERLALQRDPHTLTAHRRVISPAREGDPVTPRGTIGRSGEIGSLYIAAAGLLNLLAIISLWGIDPAASDARAPGPEQPS